jgi:hypothetical protein
MGIFSKLFGPRTPRVMPVHVDDSNFNAYSGLTWARIPAAPGQGFRNDAGAYSGSTWALIPV